jgi:hypothetical protein
MVLVILLGFDCLGKKKQKGFGPGYFELFWVLILVLVCC